MVHQFYNDINFFNLGLIIIDEEQSFGVEQKEKFKKLKPNCYFNFKCNAIQELYNPRFEYQDISLIKTPPVID